MHRGVVGELLGQVVPLATGAQSEDDGVQGGPLVDTPTSGALGRIALGEDRFDLLPQLVGHAPNGGKGLCLGIVLANRSLLSSGIVEMIADREGFEIVTKGLVVRRVAIEIAEACRLKYLQSDLVDIALDPNECLEVRRYAAGAVAEVGGHTVARLKPLATGEAGDDPSDQ